MPVRQLIAELRGGIPGNCDVCGKPTPPEQLDPVSGGEWMCWDCIDREARAFETYTNDAQAAAGGLTQTPAE